MSEQVLRFQAGFPVVIELIGASEESACRFGYKVGDRWTVSVWESGGLCGLAYNAFFPFISMYQSGGLAVWKSGGRDQDHVIRTCPDLRAGFRFRVSRGETQTSKTTPGDIHPESGCRLPLPKRDELDEEGKEIYDRLSEPQSRVLAGLKGPAGIHLHSPKLQRLETALNQHLRYDSGLSGKFRELAILVAAREMDSHFEWAAHEPQALKEGLSREIIDIVKYRKGAEGIPETEQVIILFGRQMLGGRNVDSETFARAFKIFGTKVLVELVALIANYAGTAYKLATFDVQLMPGQTRCW